MFVLFHFTDRMHRIYMCNLDSNYFYDVHGNPYKKILHDFDIIIDVVIFDKYLIVIENKYCNKSYQSQSAYMYNIHTFELLHDIKISKNKTIVSACANKYCLFVLRNIDSKITQKTKKQYQIMC